MTRDGRAPADAGATPEEGVPRQSVDNRTSADLRRLLEESTERLHAFERRYLQLTDAAPQLVWTTDEQGRVDYVNARATEYDLAHLPDGTWSWERAIHPDDSARVGRVWAEAVETRCPYEVEARIRMADGRYRWHVTRGAAVVGPGGRVTWIGTTTDIDDLRIAQSTARRNEERLRRTIDGLDAVVIFRGGAGESLAVSPQVERILGYEPGELCSLDAWNALIHPDDRQRCLATFGGAASSWELEYRLRRADGTWAWVLDRGTRTFRPDGTDDSLNTVLVDITARHEAEEGRRESETRFRTLIDELDAIVTIQATPTASTYVSPQAATILGYEPEQLASPGAWRNLVVPEDRARVFEAWDDNWTAESLDHFDLEYRVRRADGRAIWLDERMHATRGPDGVPTRWFGVAFDITARKRLEEAAAQTERLEAVGRLAGTIGQEVGNVLLGIRMHQGALAEALPETDPRRHDVDQIGLAIDRGTMLASQLFSFARGSASGSTTVEVASVLRDIAPVLAGVAGNGITFVVEAGAGEARIDRGALERALFDLVLNARDAMPDGGEIRVSVAETTVGGSTSPGLRAGRYLQIAVSDTGAGMAPEVLARAFEPFYTTKSNGTGIGLSSVYGTVREAGGSVLIESEPGRGTTVRLVLPRPPAHRRVPGGGTETD